MELSLAETLVGEGSQQRMKLLLLAHMPTATVHTDPHAVLTAVNAIMAKEAYKYAKSTTKSNTVTFKKWLARVVDDRAPDLQLGEDDDMLADLAARCPFFLVWPDDSLETGDVKTDIDALRCIAAEVNATIDKGGNAYDLATKLRVWSYLEPDVAARNEMGSLVTSVDDADESAPPAAKVAKTSSASSSSNAQVAGKSKAKHNNAVERAMAMFC